MSRSWENRFPWSAAARRLVRGRHPLGGGRGTTTRSPSTAALRCPTRARRGSPRASPARRGWSIIRRSAWTDGGFQAPPLSSALIYELHVGTFTPEGTFDGVISRLDHLKDLGVTHIELLPVADFPGRFGWGYDGVALYATRHAYGGPEGLKRLVNACHARGIAVILDVVYNHLGPSGNILPQFGHYFSERHKTPWGDALELRRPPQRSGPAFFLRQRPDVAPRLSSRRPPARRRPRDRRHVGDQLPRTARHRGRRPQGPPRPAPRPDRRERPERPPDRPPLGDRRLRHRRPVERRLPPRPALGHHRRARWVLLRLRFARRPGDVLPAFLRLQRPTFRVPAPAPRPPTDRPLGAPLPGLRPEPRPARQPCRRATGFAT